MKRNYSLKRTLLWMLCVTALLPISAWGAIINYSDFSDLSSFTLGENAQALNPSPDGRLRLSSGTWQRTGYAFLSDPMNVSNGYSTQFSFQITNLIGGGADWLCFIVSGVPFDAIDHNHVDVEIDIYNNGARDNYDRNHLGLNYDGTWVVVQPVSTSFKNGEVWNVWIDYDGMIMNIYASMDSVKPLSPYISHTINVTDKIGGPEAYIGFWAAYRSIWC